MENKITSELIEKAKQAKNPEELIDIAKVNNVELTAEEAKAYFGQFNKTGELSDDELNDVAGGGCHTKDGRLVVSACNWCNEFKYKTDPKVALCKECKYCTYEKGLWLCNNPKNMK